MPLVVLPQVLPRLGLLLQQWSPLEQPELGAREFFAWRPLLESESQVPHLFPC